MVAELRVWWFGIATLACALASLSAAAGATELRVQSNKTSLAPGESFELSLWLDLSASSTSLGVNAAGATLSWDASSMDLDITGDYAAIRDFLSTPSTSVQLSQATADYHVAGVYYDSSGIATLTLALLAARGNYSSDRTSSVIPCVADDCSRFELVQLTMKVPLVSGSGTVALAATAPAYSRSPYGAAVDSSAIQTVAVQAAATVGTLSPGGASLVLDFGRGVDLSASTFSWSPSISSLSYTVLDTQRLQLSLPGQSGLVDGSTFQLVVTRGARSSTLTLGVAIEADRLRAELSSTTVTAASSFTLSVQGVDAHGNVDLDYQLASTTTLSLSPDGVSVNAVLEPQQGRFTLSNLRASAEGAVQLTVRDGGLVGSVELLLSSTATQLVLRLLDSAVPVADSSFTLTVVAVDAHGVQDLDFELATAPLQLELSSP